MNEYLTGMRVERRVYRGIEFIQIDDLPSDQLQLIKTSPASPERIKILIDGKPQPCILYKAYCEWYASIFKKKEIAAKTITKAEVMHKA